MLCLLLSGAGMASSCRKYSSTWTCRRRKLAQRDAHSCRWEVFLARAQGLMTRATGQLRVLRAPAGDMRPSW